MTPIEQLMAEYNKMKEMETELRAKLNDLRARRQGDENAILDEISQAEMLRMQAVTQQMSDLTRTIGDIMRQQHADQMRILNQMR